MVEGNSASDERSERGLSAFFFLIPDNGYCIRKLEYLLVQTYSNPMMYQYPYFTAEGTEAVNNQYW